MTLNETAKLMLSEDYKERFIAEYWQVRNRVQKLKSMLIKWEDGMLNFTPSCSKELLSHQCDVMIEYRDILEERAKIEGIDLYGINNN